MMIIEAEARDSIARVAETKGWDGPVLHIHGDYSHTVLEYEKFPS
jgi:hypothetical protein